MGVDNKKKDTRIISEEDKARIGRVMHNCTYACDYVCVFAMNAWKCLMSF